jgi:hypothetical protein
MMKRIYKITKKQVAHTNHQNFMVYHLHKVQYEYVDYGEDFGLLSLEQIKQEDHPNSG